MVKKLLHILMATLLLIAITGINISTHYSEGELYSLSVMGEADSCCAIPCGCCDNKLVPLKLNNDFVVTTYPTLKLKTPSLALTFFSYDEKLKLLSHEHTIVQYPFLCWKPSSQQFSLLRVFRC